MSELSGSALSSWQSFYLIIGPSATALIGIQFLVITLIASTNRPATADSVSAFGTPTVVHLVSTLVISTIMIVPWPSRSPASIALAMCGLAGIGYGALVIRRACRQTFYLPDREDWFWYAVLPCGVYAMLLLSAVLLHSAARHALFITSAAALGLLLIGIHNAWDSVTHIVIQRPHEKDEE